MRIYAPLNTEAEPLLQEIEIATFFQLPSFHIIGLPGPEVAEAKERVRSAIEASHLEFPKRRVVLNLSPAHIRKKGTGLDLAMALGVLTAPSSIDLSIGAWGALGLDGSVKPVGQLTRSLYAAWQGNLTHLFLAEQELPEAQNACHWIERCEKFKSPPPTLVPVHSLAQAWKLLQSGLLDSPDCPALPKHKPPPDRPGFPSSQPCSQRACQQDPSTLLPLPPALERTIGIATAGLHHLLLLGPRGAGKSQALEWLLNLQLPLSAQDRLQQRLIREMNSLHPDDYPVRRISSQVRPGALLGNASEKNLRAGEFSLAHGGLLIADELPEWPRDSREALREPLERGQITLTRAQGSLELPARFLLAANGNFCPCGGWPRSLPLPEEWARQSQSLPQSLPLCRCPLAITQKYLAKLSGPLLDRIDLTAIVTPPTESQMNEIYRLGTSVPKKFEALQKHVIQARTLLCQTWGKPPGLMSAKEIEALIQTSLQRQAHGRLDSLPFISNSFNSLRSRHKTARLAMSLAAWDGVAEPDPTHWMEASYYRPEKFLPENNF